MSLVRFEVELRVPEMDDAWDKAWESLGSVLLPHDAPREQLEHALATVGVYAPRGLDSVVWEHEHPAIQISDADGECFVRLTGR